MNQAVETESPRRLYLPGIDALRGALVIVGMLYHANVAVFQTGFFFVDVFGVLSGYLITRLLLGEIEFTGRVGLKNFYLNRARRLLPILVATLVAVTLWARAFEPQILGDLRTQVIAALTYVYNWYVIFAGSDYFNSYDIVPIQHLWTLSLEEQFYIIWPVALLGLIALLRRRRRVIPVLLVIGALASAWAMHRIYYGGDTSTATDMVRAPMTVFGAEANRLMFTYMSTITRAGGFLVGCALAFWWQPERIAALSPRRAQSLDLLGVAAAIGTLLVTNLQWFTTELHALAVSGGQLIVWVLCVILIVAFTRQESRWLHWLFTRKPLIRLGIVSYALYLFHWPAMQFIRKYPFKPLSWTVLLIWFPILYVIAELSQRYFERPVRRLGVKGWLAGMRPAVRRIVVAVSCAATLSATAALAFAPPSSNPIEDGANGQAQLDGVKDGESVETVAIGDSITVFAYRSYRDAGVTVDASSARTFVEGAEIAEYLVAQKQVTDSIVIHLGSNERLEEARVRRLLDATEGLRRVVLVTIHRPGWAPAEENNRIIRSMVAQYRNVAVADWETLALNNPSYVRNDGIHLAPEGVQRYVDLNLTALRATTPQVFTEPLAAG